MGAIDTGDGGNSAKVLQQINNMISSNMLILGVFFILLIALCLALYYFALSLMSTISYYNASKMARKSQLTGKGESMKDTSTDNEIYAEPVDPKDVEQEFDPTPQIDPKKFMPSGKREFVKQLAIDNEDYNKQKSAFLTNEMKYKENDDIVDEKVMYKDYDNYKYTYEKDE
jgi:hypothetical protein